MPRTTPEQENLLEQIRVAHRARLTARTVAEQEARELVNKRMHEAYVAESRLVRRALDSGISRRKVGLEGLGSGDYHSITKLLSFTEPEERHMQLLAKGDQRVRLVEDPAERVTIAPAYDQPVPPRGVPVARVEWPEYNDANGTHHLRGYVRLSDDGTYWVGLTDDEEAEEPGDGVLFFDARTVGSRLHNRLMNLVNEA